MINYRLLKIVVNTDLEPLKGSLVCQGNGTLILNKNIISIAMKLALISLWFFENQSDNLIFAHMSKPV